MSFVRPRVGTSRTLRPVEPLADLTAEPGLVAVFLDVDGVLAPIVERPEDARVPEETRVELRRLAARYALVACVTGRPSDDAREIVGVDEVEYAGEHGLELDPEAAEWGARVQAFADGVAADAERKPLSLAYHYRSAANPELARAALEDVAAAAAAAGLRARWGRMVLEVLPPIDATKGTAVRYLLASRGLRRALYAGDDTTDLDGFAALDGLDVAVRVAVASPEGPPDLKARADIVVSSTGELLGLLQRL
jgi:trehalose 6-phosphate phosphatase